MIINVNFQNEHLHLTAANSKRLPAQVGIIANCRTQKCLLPQKFLLTSGLPHYQTVGSQLEQVMPCCCPRYPHLLCPEIVSAWQKTEVNFPSSICPPRKLTIFLFSYFWRSGKLLVVPTTFFKQRNKTGRRIIYTVLACMTSTFRGKKAFSKVKRDKNIHILCGRQKKKLHMTFQIIPKSNFFHISKKEINQQST